MGKVIKITENDIQNIVKNSIATILNENFGDKISGMWKGFKQGNQSINNAMNTQQNYVNMRFGVESDMRKNISLAYTNIRNAVVCLNNIKNKVNWAFNYISLLKDLAQKVYRFTSFGAVKNNKKLTENDINNIIKNAINEGILNKIRGGIQGYQQGGKRLDYLNQSNQNYNNLTQGVTSGNNNIVAKNTELAINNLNNAYKCLSNVKLNDSEFGDYGLSEILSQLKNLRNGLSQKYSS